jgi:PTH2 family peptidyl-tRNA hydrolase
MVNDVKQVIVMRTDTDPPMRKGKMCAQAAHASLAFITRRIPGDSNSCTLKLKDPELKWLNGSFTKVCVRVDSEHELMEIYHKAQTAGLEVHIVKDSGKTEFKEPTFTCMAIGPDYSSKIDPITGHLKLL